MNDFFFLFSYGIIFLILFPIFYFCQINFSLLLNYKLLLFPTAYKTLLVYLYGFCGGWAIVISYGISVLCMGYYYLKQVPINRKIIYIPVIVPLCVSYFAYFFTNQFIFQGVFGSLVGQLILQKIGYYSYVVSILLLLLLYFFFSGRKGMRLLGSFIKRIIVVLYKIIQILCLNEAVKFVYYNFLAWIKYIFRTKRISIDESYHIEKLLYEVVLEDFKKGFYLVRKDDTHVNVCGKKTTQKKPFGYYQVSLPMKKFFQTIDLEELHYCETNLIYFNIAYDSIIGYQGPLVNTIIITPQKHITMQKIHEILPNFIRIMGRPDLRFIYPLREYPQAVGFEYGHQKNHILFFNERVQFEEIIAKKPLEIPFGLDTMGNIFFYDLCQAPHILLCGTTGSGKSSVMQSIITALLIKHTEESLQLVLIDPKKSEFFYFNNLPHLIFPICYEIEETENAISQLLEIMQERYRIFNQFSVKNIEEYKEKYGSMTYIVVCIDEYADLIMQSRTLEKKIIRLLQMSRAAGIHVIVSTQRPSVDIINSTIKSNLPVRIACRVTNAVNSRIILDIEGAEKLQGRGDMLISIYGEITRIHGFLVPQEFLEELVDFYKQSTKR